MGVKVIVTEEENAVAQKIAFGKIVPTICDKAVYLFWNGYRLTWGDSSFHFKEHDYKEVDFSTFVNIIKREKRS